MGGAGEGRVAAGATLCVARTWVEKSRRWKIGKHGDQEKVGEDLGYIGDLS